MEVYVPRTPSKYKLTAADIADMQHDLVLAAEVLFGEKLPTATRLRFKVWQKYAWNYDCSGWASFKTDGAAKFAAAIVSVFDDWEHAIIGLIGRTAQKHFMEIEKLYYRCPIFRGRMAKKPTHHPDGFELRALGGGGIIALPADLNKMGQRLENESFNSVTVEEVTRFVKLEVLNLIDSRVRKPNKHRDILDNKTLYLGSAEDADAAVFRERIEPVVKGILAGEENYSYLAMNVELLNEFEDCRPFLRMDAYYNAQKTMSETRFAQKWKGQFQSGTGDLYPSAIWKADSPRHFAIDKRRKKSTTVTGYDVGLITDKFAMKAIEILGPGKPSIVRYGYSYRPKGNKNIEIARHVYRDYDNFKPAIIVIDVGGSGWWFINAIYEYAKSVGREPLVVWNGPEEGRRIIYPFSSKDQYIKLVLGKHDASKGQYVIEGDDHLKNASHEGLMSAFKNEAIAFASSIHVCDNDVVEKLKPQEFEHVEDIEEAVLRNFDETKAQARDLRKDKDREGNVKLTSKGYYFIKGVNDDDIQSLVHTWTAKLIYDRRQRANASDELQRSGIGICTVLETDLNGQELEDDYVH